MLADRFPRPITEHLAAQAVATGDGKVAELRTLEGAGPEDGASRKAARGKKGREDACATARGGRSRNLANGWSGDGCNGGPGLSPRRPTPICGPMSLSPATSGSSRAPRTGGIGGAGSIEKLSAGGMAVRMVEPEVKALPAGDAEAVFSALRERVLQAPSLSAPPPGFEGLEIVAKHHAKFQTELMALVGSLDAKALGIWIVRGWNEVLTERAAEDQLRTVMTQWAKQDENSLLKKAAGQALGGLRSTGR